MSSLPPQTPHDLGEFAEFLRWLSREGFEFSVIGGQAVAAYARLLRESVRSVDLDLYITQETMFDLLEQAPRNGVRVVKRPQSRNIQVAVLDFDGMEINALTATEGLLPPEVIARTARPFTLSAYGDLEVPVVDPFDLLKNKLAIARAKDLPHIEILLRFVEQEVVEAFTEERQPRMRLLPARRLMEVLGRRTLPAELAERLLDLDLESVDCRFLAGRLPHAEQAQRLLNKTTNEELRMQLVSILRIRQFEDEDPRREV